jgi:hypothetical protein
MIQTGARAGVLIIGSLWWDGRFNRKEWRSERLDISSARLVRTRIRYGRLSKGPGRQGTYTMTFSGSAERGTAYAVALRQRIHRFVELDAEVRALAAAEGFENLERWPRWGVVGLRARDAVAPSVSGDIVDLWSGYFSAHATASRVQEVHGPGETPQVDARGHLTLEWPQDYESGDPLDFDLLLATANVPDLDGGRYASPTEIAKSLVNVACRADYFCCNVLSGIRTSEDAEIWHEVEQLSPAWLQDEKYEQLARVLEGRSEYVIFDTKRESRPVS